MHLYGYEYNSTLYIIKCPLNSKHIDNKGKITRNTRVQLNFHF